MMTSSVEPSKRDTAVRIGTVGEGMVGSMLAKLWIAPGLRFVWTESEDRAGSPCPAWPSMCSLSAANFSVFRFGREFLDNSSYQPLK
jgi:hypothetical protein